MGKLGIVIGLLLSIHIGSAFGEFVIHSYTGSALAEGWVNNHQFYRSADATPELPWWQALAEASTANWLFQHRGQGMAHCDGDIADVQGMAGVYLLSDGTAPESAYGYGHLVWTVAVRSTEPEVNIDYFWSAEDRPYTTIAGTMVVRNGTTGQVYLSLDETSGTTSNAFDVQVAPNDLLVVEYNLSAWLDASTPTTTGNGPEGFVHFSPEPGTLTLLGLGVLVWVRRR